MTHSVKIVGDGPVVMVDDSDMDTFLAKRCYERSGLTNEFMGLESAAALLNYLADVNDGVKPMPALILLDINMPVIDGFEALAKIRGVGTFAKLPVISILSNSDDPREAEKALQLGANGFFTKPSNINDYVAFFDSLAS